MNVTTLNSGSSGNGYVLQNGTEALIIECGCPVQDALKAIDFDTQKVVGVIISHEHGDHMKYVEDYMKYFTCYCSKGSMESFHFKGDERPKQFESLKKYELGNFTIRPFSIEHDAAEPLGFVIEHNDMGRLLFATDTYYIKYKFRNLDHIMIECSYRREFLEDNVNSGLIHPALRDRMLASHMSIEHLKEMLEVTDKSKLKKIILLHLSGLNSDRKEFRKEIEDFTMCKTFVASKNITISLNKLPF